MIRIAGVEGKHSSSSSSISAPQLSYECQKKIQKKKPFEKVHDKQLQMKNTYAWDTCAT